MEADKTSISGGTDLAGYSIGVLAGGPSSERAISLKSGQAVYDALLRAGLDVVFIDIPDNSLAGLSGYQIDIAFITLHGRFGEDGAIQELLEKRGIPYTGSGPAASKTALDKISSKKIFEKANIPVPAYHVPSGDCEGIKKAMSFPCVVKPQYEGSSIGLSIVDMPGKLAHAVDAARAYGGDVIIEDYIDGREMTVGVLDDVPLPVVEIVPCDGIYDFTAKYEDVKTEYIVPARMDEMAYIRAQETGLAAHRALGCRGMSRVDMRMDNNNDIYVLEVNTIPGLTERSLLPMAAKAAGMDFRELCMKILKSAFL